MRIVCVAISLFGAVTHAQATTISVGGSPIANEGQASSVAGATTVNFNTLSNGGPQGLTSGIADYSNLFIRSGVTTDIVGDSSPFASPMPETGDLNVSFSRPIVYFGLYWGSPDPLNTITFFSGATPVFTYTAQNLHDQMGVPFGSGNAAYVNFTAEANESYTRIVFSSGRFPFEQDNHAFIEAVPEPGSYFLMAIGLSLVLAASRRLRRSVP